AFVTPALKRGLNPAGLFVSAGEVVLLSTSFFCTSSAAELFAAAAKRGVKPVGAAFAVSPLGVLLGSFFSGFNGVEVLTGCACVSWRGCRCLNLLNQNFLLWSKLFSPISL